MMNLRRPAVLWTAAGLLAGFGAGLGLRACAQQPAPAASPAPTGTDEGRYRVVVGPSAPAEVFLVDTQTGATWQRAKDPKTQQDVFAAVRVQPAMPPMPMFVPSAPRPRP